MVRSIRAVCVGALAACLGACAEPDRTHCTAGFGVPVSLFTLYFGKAIPGRGDVTDNEWQSFLDDTIAANLPNGYTVLDANGGWMNPITRKTVKEATKVVVVALPEVADSRASIDRVRKSYQVRFRQQLVGVTVEHACGAF